MSSNQRSHQKDQSQQVVKKDKPKQEKAGVKLSQMLEAPETLSYDEVIDAQQQLGNQVVQRAFTEVHQKKALTDDQGNLRSDISDEIQNQRGGGTPLPDQVRENAEGQFMQDFGDVRLHSDEKADELSDRINARAFTIGKDIFFKRGVFEPGTKEGRETLHHELTHVLQQSGGGDASGQLKLGEPDTEYEQEADQVGKQISQGENAVQMQSQAVGVVQRGIKDFFKNLFGSKQEEEIPTEEEEEISEDEIDDLINEMTMELEAEEGLEGEEEGEEMEELDLDALLGELEGEEEGEDIEELDLDALLGELEGEEEGEDIEELDLDALLEDLEGEEGEEVDLDALLEELGGEEEGEELDLDAMLEELGSEEEGEELDLDALLEELGGEEEGEELDLDAMLEELGGEEEGEELDLDALLEELGGEEEGEELDLDALLEGEDLDDELEEELENLEAELVIEEIQKEIQEERRQELINIAKDPNSSEEEAREAREELKALHGGKKSSLMDVLFPKYNYASLQTERLKALEKNAKMGDKEAYKKWQAEKPPSTMEKFKSGAGKVGGGIWGVAKGLFGSTAKDLKEHFLGPEKKKEAPKEEKPSPSPVTVNVGGGNGGGGGMNMMEIMEKYADLKVENKMLREKLGIKEEE